MLFLNSSDINVFTAVVGHRLLSLVHLEIFLRFDKGRYLRVVNVSAGHSNVGDTVQHYIWSL